MRAVHIETDGTPRKTIVTDVNSGERIPGIRAMSWTFVSTQAVSDVVLTFRDGTTEQGS